MTAYLESMGTAVTFIDTHLEEPINLRDIAAAVSYSLFHFCRIFNQTVHHSPHDYLIRRRLTEAARRLVAGEERITDLAFRYQFGSPESFSRAFRRMFGVLPSAWRKQGVRHPRLLMRPLTPAHLKQRNGLPAPVLVEMPALTLVGLMQILSSATAVNIPLALLPHPATHRVIHYPPGWHRHGRLLFLGTVGENAVPPLVMQQLPAMNYARFPLPESAAECELLSDYIYQTWLPQAGYALAAQWEILTGGNLYLPVVPE